MSSRFTNHDITPPRPQGGAVNLLDVAEIRAVADEWRWDRRHPRVAKAPVETIHRGFGAAIAAAATTSSEAA